MAHELAKLMLEQGGAFLDRAEAIRTAVFLGMPLREIEEYLDWLGIARVGDTVPLKETAAGGSRAPVPSPRLFGLSPNRGNSGPDPQAGMAPFGGQ